MSRMLRALAQRIWGAADICRNVPLLDRLGDPRSETTIQEWRFAVVQVPLTWLPSVTDPFVTDPLSEVTWVHDVRNV